MDLLHLLFSGSTGFVLVDLAFVAAMLATAGYLRGQALGTSSPAAQPWLRLGRISFVVHAVSVLAVFAVLLGMVILQRYEYHYVWAHSSNELPLQYVVASLWEGQEGSFLMWMVWHAVLGLVLLRACPPTWRPGVLGIVASVQAILASMVLGVYLPAWLVKGLLLGLQVVMLAVAARAVWRHRRPESDRVLPSLLVGGLFVLLTTWLLLAKGMTGVLAGRWWTLPYGLVPLYLLVYALAWWRWARRVAAPVHVVLTGLLAVGIALVFAGVPLGDTKIGSSPFLLLRDAMPGEAIWQTDPDFVPQNGNGLNSLLQNYWMVIHPPTLFLGFALTLVPFAFVLAALLRRDYAGWVKPATPWMILSALVLGVGILMGGYWAYETLNFGGYWNWDPVENASLVPWLTGVASLHVGMAYRHGRVNLRSGMLLVLATFLLVLYSTFLTRSGILGDASVHSFTDLGLSGQLFVLLAAYLLLVLVLLALRWDELPTANADRPFWSRETFLFLAALTLTFSATMISVVTSLPVFNQLFDTHLAPSGKIQLFYYKWNVWFGIAIGLLSAVGQFIYWNKIERERLLSALFRPFATAAIAASVLIVVLFAVGWQFTYAETFRVAVQAARDSGSTPNLVLSYLGNGLLAVADELLLFAGLFTILANLDILVQLVRRSRGIRTIGGSLAHMGFGLMLLGILFSSGYEKTVSVNMTPAALGDQFDAEARKDNVLLVRHQPVFVPGYQVVYRGKRQAQPPISQLWEVSRDAERLRVGFRDAAGIRYGVDIPWVFFQMPAGQGLAHGLAAPNSGGTPSVDFAKLHGFVEQNLPLIQPQQLDGRDKYLLEFTPLDAEHKHPDTSRTFVLMPEAEVSERMGLVLHPDRHVRWDGDLYTFVSSIPRAEADTAAQQFETVDLRLAKGDSAQLRRATVVLDNIVQVTDVPEAATPGVDAVLRAKLRILSGGLSYAANPVLVVAGKEARHLDATVPQLDMRFSFEGIAQSENSFQLVLRVTQAVEPDDFITFKAVDKPLIGLLWLGTFVMTFGFALAAVRRFREGRAVKPAAPIQEPANQPLAPQPEPAAAEHAVS